jgi:hypothetical protein
LARRTPTALPRCRVENLETAEAGRTQRYAADLRPPAPSSTCPSGFGVGPALSGLEIALQRSVVPTAVAGALSTLILVRQVGGANALAAADTVYSAGTRAGSPAATATGTGVLVVTLTGAALAAGALGLLPRGSGRLPAPDPSTLPPAAIAGQPGR